jgi:uncharacterized protein
VHRRLSNHPLALFLLLVFVVEWAAALALFPLAPVAVGVIALVPTPIALLTAALVEGRQGMRQLLRRSLKWRVGLEWYALAILIPTAIHLLAAMAASFFGARLDPSPVALLAMLPLTLVLAAGEEIGWQGYALPHLRRRFTLWRAALVFGLLHAAFHLPMYLLPLPAEFRQAAPFPLFLLMAIAFALYRVWLFDRTNGNVPLAIVYHAAINTSVVLVIGVDREMVGWLLPAAWVAGALPLFALPALARRWRSTGTLARS